MNFASTSLIRKYAGQWVAWSRQQDRIISTGRTFEEAKQGAARVGEQSVLLTKASDRGSRRPHWLCAVAVFIALGSSGVLPASSLPAAANNGLQVSVDDTGDLDDQSDLDDQTRHRDG